MALGALAGGAVAERIGYRTICDRRAAVAALGFWRFCGWPYEPRLRADDRSTCLSVASASGW